MNDTQTLMFFCTTDHEKTDVMFVFAFLYIDKEGRKKSIGKQKGETGSTQI